MNLPVFLNKTDTLTANLSHEDLEGFIHEMARTLPEGRRDDFLGTLESFAGQGAPREAKKGDGYESLRADVEAAMERLDEIHEGERCLDSEYNVEWDEWYNDDVDEFLFSDSEGVLADIDEAIELVHRCIDMETYKEGYELAETLSLLEVMVEGVYVECAGDSLHMEELNEHDLLSCNFKTMVKECLYVTYMGNDLADRPEEMFRMMDNFRCYDISLENILQMGNDDLPEFDEFLAGWISYLGEMKGCHARDFLKEAQAMLPDEDAKLENARKYVGKHPALFEQMLRAKLGSGENEKMLQIGREALDKIPYTYTVRGEIALLTAEYACKLQDKAAMEDCWLEAFHSNSTVVGYLRIRMRTENWAKYKDDVRAIYERLHEESKEKSEHGYAVYDRNKQRENHLQERNYLAILFFEEQFGKVMEIGMKEKNALGCSSTFMKQGMALFLLLLYNAHDAGELPAGLKTMLSRAFDACTFKAEEYFRGTGVPNKAGDYDVFWKVFCRWKENVQITEEQKNEWLDKIDEWVELRVRGIMDGSKRNYYGECASYIAALGEVQESVGVFWAKERIMERYKNEYSRRRAFHQELRGYGMKK